MYKDFRRKAYHNNIWKPFIYLELYSGDYYTTKDFIASFLHISTDKFVEGTKPKPNPVLDIVLDWSRQPLLDFESEEGKLVGDHIMELYDYYAKPLDLIIVERIIFHEKNGYKPPHEYLKDVTHDLMYNYKDGVDGYYMVHNHCSEYYFIKY